MTIHNTYRQPVNNICNEPTYAANKHLLLPTSSAADHSCNHMTLPADDALIYLLPQRTSRRMNNGNNPRRKGTWGTKVGPLFLLFTFSRDCRYSCPARCTSALIALTSRRSQEAEKVNRNFLPFPFPPTWNLWNCRKSEPVKAIMQTFSKYKALTRERDYKDV